ncbi:MAG: cysteine methyltransferase [Betaproteobacteria bacterium HGW-Betaproteobacteria-3]|jgi:methylated-DNA-[protein]-cysteine S-methyltransferase|nr:MAG: cysteine methyltransferase [Betaproteobacteria bacterium HGW-Betaproteobacteria-3]
MKKQSEIVYTHYRSPMGRMVIAASATGLTGAWFEGQKHMPELSHWTLLPEPGAHPVLAQAVHELTRFFNGQAPRFSVPLDLRAGTPFQQQVWAALQRIGYGQTVSYGALAQQLGRPTGARAVGAAVGRNPVSVIVPCHRVLGAGGALTGYAGGLDRKTGLLRLEALRGSAAAGTAPAFSRSGD